MIDNKRFRKVQGYIYDNESDEGDGLLNLTEIEDTMNSLHEENQRFEDTVREAIKNERTELGQSVLKNLAANLGIRS